MNSKTKKISKKQIFIIAVAVLVAVSAVFAFFHLFNSKMEGNGAPLPQGYSICLEPPEDGSKPEDHTALENIGYIVGRLSKQAYYHSESASTAKASALFGSVNVTQNVVGSKDYKDGILIVTTISSSGSSFAPSKAMQRFYGANKAVVRNAASDNKDDWNGLETEWSSGAPSEILTREQHTSRYGLWATEFSDYVVTEKTLLTADAMPQKDADGYVLRVSLSVAADSETGMQDATQYYKRQMRTMGDLDDYPEFSSAELTFYFSEDWTLNKLETDEVYKSKKGFTAECTGHNVVTYSYAESEVDVSDYQTYFINYADMDVTGPQEEERTAADYLAEAFAPVLTSDASYFVLDATVAGQPVSGVACVRMQSGALRELQVSLGDLQILYREDTVFIQYFDFYGKVRLEDIGAMFSADNLQLDMQALEQSIAGGVLTETTNGAVLECRLPLGVLDLPIVFHFVTEGESIRCESIQSELNVLDVPVSLFVTMPTQEREMPEVNTDACIDLYPLIQDLYMLIQEGRFDLGIEYRTNDFSLEGDLLVALKPDLSVCGNLLFTYSGTEFPIAFTLIGEDVWFTFSNISIHSTVSEAKELLREFTGALPSVELPFATTEEVVASILSMDFSSILQDFRTDLSGIYIKVDIEALMAGLGINLPIEPGVIEGRYDLNKNEIEIVASGIRATVGGSTERIEAPTDTGYAELRELMELARTVSGLVQGEGLAFEMSGRVKIDALEVEIDLQGEIRYRDGLQIYAQCKLNGNRELELYYSGETGWVRYEGWSLRITKEDLTKLMGQGEVEGIAGLKPNAQGLMELIASMGLRSGSDGWLEIEGDFGSVISGLEAAGIRVKAEGGAIRAEAERLKFGTIELSGAAVRAESRTGSLTVEEPAGLGENGFKIAVEYAANGMTIRGEIVLELGQELNIGGALELERAGQIIPIELKKVGTKIWLSVGGIKIKTTQEELQASLAELGELFGMEMSGLPIPSQTGGMDVREILESVEFEKAGIVVRINGEALVAGLGINLPIEPGVIEGRYDLNKNEIEIVASGIRATVGGSTERIEAPTDTGYAELRELMELARTVSGLVQGEGLAFEMSGRVKIDALEVEIDLQGEIRYRDGLQIYAQILLDGTHILRVWYCDGSLQFSYNGYTMTANENELNTIMDTFSSIYASNADQLSAYAAPMLLFSSDGIDLFSLLQSIKMTASREGVLDVAVDLSAFFEGAAVQGLEIRVDADILNVRAGEIMLAGAKVYDLSMDIKSAQSFTTPDFSGDLYCSNIFTFLLNAYTEVAQTQDLSIAVEYDSTDLYANVEGVLHLDQEAGSADRIMNLQFNAEIYEGGKSAPSGKHFIRLTIVHSLSSDMKIIGQVYISYSRVGFDVGTPLNVKMPVSSLFAAGKTILPLLAPILGIQEDIYYYNFVVSILDGYVESLNSTLFGVMDTEAWCALIVGIIDEYTPKDVAGQIQGEATSGGANVSYDMDALWINIETDDVAVKLAALKEPAQITAPTGADGYIDISTIAQLLGDLLQAYEYRDTGYQLQGFIEMSVLNLFDLDFKINVDLRIGVEKDGRIYLNANLRVNEYSNVAGLLLFGTKCIVDGNTETDITFKDGMIYMTRVRTSEWNGKEIFGSKFNSISPKYEYRKMTVAEFGADAMNQIFFALNFSEKFKSYINGQTSDEGGEVSDTADVGEMIGSYQFSDSTQTYTVGADLGAILGNSSLGELNLAITRQARGDGSYDLTVLDGTLTLVSLITAHFNVTHVSCGQTVDFSVLDQNMERVDSSVLPMAA